MMIKKFDEDGDSYWAGKMSVDEIRTILKHHHKYVYLQEGYTRVLDVNGNKVVFAIDQSDKSISFYLDNFERDTLLPVNYDEYSLTIML